MMKKKNKKKNNNDLNGEGRRNAQALY